MEPSCWFISVEGLAVIKVRRNRAVLVFVYGLLGVLLLGRDAFLAAQGESVTMAANDPRPLAELIRSYQSRVGRPITYEDFRFDLVDVVDVTDRTRNPKSKAPMHRVFHPRGGPLSVVLPATHGPTSVVDMKTAIGSFIQAYGARGYPGQFRVFEEEGVLHVAPAVSVLDAAVSLPPAPERSVLEALDQLLGQLAQQTGQDFILGTAPAAFLQNAAFEQQASDADARTTLVRILRATGQPISWRLLYSLDLQQYALNLKVVSKTDLPASRQLR